VELDDARIPRQDGADALALDANTASMDQPNLSEALCVSGGQIILDDGGDVLRREWVEIYGVLDRYRHRPGRIADLVLHGVIGLV